MAMLLRRAIQGVLITASMYLGWHFYELHQQLQDLQTEVISLQRDVLVMYRAQEDAKKSIEVETYRLQGTLWAKAHPAPKKPRTKKPTWQKFRMSAYIAKCKEGCSGKTATGYRLTSAKKDRVIAVDPRIIPLYSVVEIEGYGVYRALDTGGAIRGNELDLFVDSVKHAKQIGVRSVKIRILRKGKQHSGGHAL